MSGEIRLAFEHPEARAAATDAEAADPLDRISLRDYVVDVEIGAFQQERGTTQQVSFNIVVEVQPVVGPIEDDVDRILSYDKITEAIAVELAAERLNLLETLAERIADRVLLEPQAKRVFVRIEKLDRGPGALGVEIVRAKTAAVLQIPGQDAPHPMVLCLSNAAIHHRGLSALIDRMEERHGELVLCVGMPETGAPKSGAALAQRRIDLLAIEQNAWVLAGRDRRCVVVSTRTELDWAMKNGQISVWAPSKIVLDAVDAPSAGPDDAIGLARWFTKEMQGSALNTVDAAAPGADLATREVAIEAQA